MAGHGERLGKGRPGAVRALEVAGILGGSYGSGKAWNEQGRAQAPAVLPQDASGQDQTENGKSSLPRHHIRRLRASLAGSSWIRGEKSVTVFLGR